MSARRYLALLFITLMTQIPASTSSAADPERVVSIEGITEFHFENGLKLLLFPDQSRPTVTVNLTIFVGSRHEGYGESGMAHLLEHMVFKGTPEHPNVPKVLQERGARFNGTTWLDRTNYYETLPASDDNLEFALRLEADRMVNSFIRGEDLESEMTVVRNEFERGENSPRRILSQRMESVAFEWHNYGKSTIGNKSDIERVPITKLRAFYRRFYQPDNAMVIVAGQFDEQKAIELVGKYFGSLPRPARELDETYTEEPPQDGEREVVLRRVGDNQLVGVAYHVPSGPHPEYAAVDVLAYILATEPAGRLYKALIETKQATSVYGSTYALHDPGLLTMMVETRKEDSLDEVRKVLLHEVERIGAEGVSEEEVARIRQQILSQRERSLANTSQLAVHLSEWAAQGDWRLFFLYRDRIEKVTAADVQAVAAKYLKQNNRTVGLFIPTEKAERVSIPSTPSVSNMVADYEGRETVAAGEQFDASPANIESRTTRYELSSGLKVALLPKRTRGEAVHVRLTLRYGTPENLQSRNAATSLMPALMARGTKSLTYQEIQDSLDKNLATLSASGSVGEAVFSIQTKRANLPAVLELLRQVLREPTFPAEELDVIRRERLARLEQAQTDPQSLASRRLSRTSAPYPKSDVRYSPTIEEDIERLTNVGLSDVTELYSEYLGAQYGELVVVGDFESSEIQPVLEDLLGHWDSQKPYARIPRTAFTDVPGGQQDILTPDKANAMYLARQVLSLKDSDPEYPALVVGNFVLGGGSLSSRLGDRVRQQDGLSYGVGSQFDAASRDSLARLTLYAIANPGNVAKVVIAIREELERILKDGITDEELARAKQGYLQAQRVTRTQDRRLISILSNTIYADRTMSHYSELEEQIEKLTAEDVLTAMQRHFDPDRLVVVTAGDFAAAKAAANVPRPAAESLFNGKDLDGWTIENDGQFSVQNGFLLVNKGTGWLRSNKEYGDFVMRMEFRFNEKEANSGIFIRTAATSKNDENGWPDNGYQVQCMDIITGERPLASMIPYGAPPYKDHFDSEALAKAYKPTGQWNTYEIECVGEELSVALNGVEVTTATDIKRLRGHVGIQAEHGLLEFRSIEIESK